MGRKRKKKGAGAASGTLNDEAAGNGSEGLSFGGLMMKDLEKGEGSGQPGGREEAISSNFLLSGSQGRNEISEVLARRDGDSEVFLGEEGAGRTVYQQRILEAAREARARYFEARDAKNAAAMAKYGGQLVRFVDALTSEGLNEDPEVLDLIHEQEVDELSVVLDAEVVANLLRAQKEKNAEAIPDSAFGSPVAASGEKRDVGREIDLELKESGVNALINEGKGGSAAVAEPPPIQEKNLEDDEFEDRVTTIPNPPAKRGEVPKEPIKPVRPSSPPRRKSIPPVAAQKEGGIDRWEEGITEKEERFFNNGESGAFRSFVKPDGSIDIEKLYGDGTAPLADRVAKERMRNKKAVHVVGDPSKRKAETALGMPAALLESVAGKEKPAPKMGQTQAFSSWGAAGDERMTGLGVMGDKETNGGGTLSRTNIFGQYDNDPEMAMIAEEGSGALRMEHLSGIRGAPSAPKDPLSERIPTGSLPAAGNLASLEGTGILTPEHISKDLKDAQAASRKEGAPPSSTDGGPKVWGEHVFAQTRLSSAEEPPAAGTKKELQATRDEKPKEDFSIYGDIFYVVEKVYMESTGIPEELKSRNNFAAMLPDAIRKAEMLSRVMKADAKKGETIIASIEEQRVARLKQFKADFFEIPEGREAPKKSFLAYTQWLERKKGEYSAISDVHALLGKALAGDLLAEKGGVSPGEYGRIGMLRLCNAAIKKGVLSEEEEAKVERLREMLEPAARGEKDIYAQTIAAEATYEMIVGFATKEERERARKIEQELSQYKMTVADFEAKRERMVNVLIYALQALRGAEKDAADAKRRIRDALVELEPDAAKRERLVKLVMAAQAGKGEIGRELQKEAEKKIAETVELSPEGVREAVEKSGKAPAAKPAKPAEPISNTELARRLLASTPGAAGRAAPAAEGRAPRQAGPVARSIGSAITMAAGAALLAAGLWLNQNGIITLGMREEESAQRAKAAQVEATETAEELPAGVPADAGKETAGKAAGIAPAQKADGGVSSDAGPAEIVGGKATGAQEEGEEEEYLRDKAGLKKALDDWCQKEGGLLVDGGVLRAAYASIEGKLDGKVLPQDKEWAPLMLGMKFPNRVIELAIMSDLARSQLEPAEMYATLMRLSIVLGERAGNPKSFYTSIKEANAKGISLPPLGKESHVGKIEGAKTGERCLFAAYHESVSVRMAEIKKEALGSGVSKEEFRKAVSLLLGENAERVFKLFESSNYEANSEERKDYCRALTGGKRGSAALERALGFVIPKWEAKRKKARAEQDKYQREVNEIIGPPAPENANGKTPNKKRGDHMPAPSPCAQKEGTDYYHCVNELNMPPRKEGAGNGMKPNRGEVGSASKAPRMFVRY
ncbi:MAG: hypothetical protein QXH30_00725 [Candidatus Bilamarchaeaceae archaeon]